MFRKNMKDVPPYSPLCCIKEGYVVTENTKWTEGHKIISDAALSTKPFRTMRNKHKEKEDL